MRWRTGDGRGAQPAAGNVQRVQGAEGEALDGVVPEERMPVGGPGEVAVSKIGPSRDDRQDLTLEALV